MPDMQVRFESVNGKTVVIRAWRDGARFWIEVVPQLDEQAARRWLELRAPGKTEEGLLALRDEVRTLDSRVHGFRFLPSIEKTAVLIKTRPQYLVL